LALFGFALLRFWLRVAPPYIAAMQKIGSVQHRPTTVPRFAGTSHLEGRGVVATPLDAVWYAHFSIVFIIACAARGPRRSLILYAGRRCGNVAVPVEPRSLG
jgi:hypothetical protein